MKKYNREDFYVVYLGFNKDNNKLTYPEVYKFINIYQKNHYFALAFKKNGYYVDLINHQVFGENTGFCVKEKKSLAEILIGPGKITKLQAILELIYCVPLFAKELGIDISDKKEEKENNFKIKVNKSFKYPNEVIESKLTEIEYQGDFYLSYQNKDFSLKKLNNIPKKRELESTLTTFSVNDFYFAIVKENLQEEDNICNTIINTNYPEKYLTLFLKLLDGTLWDILNDRLITQNNAYRINSILYQEPLANYSSVVGNITRADALEEAKVNAKRFLNVYTINFLLTENENQNISRKRTNN